MRAIANRKAGRRTFAMFVVSALIVAAGCCVATPAQHAHAVTLTKVKSVKITNVTTEGFTVNWTRKTKSSKAKGYQIHLYKNGTKYRSYTIKDRVINLKTLRSLPSGAKYTTKVRAYKVVNGKRQYGKWSDSKTVSTNKVPTLGKLSFMNPSGTVVYTIGNVYTFPSESSTSDGYVAIDYQAQNLSNSIQSSDIASVLNAYQGGSRLTETIFDQSDHGYVNPKGHKSSTAFFKLKSTIANGKFAPSPVTLKSKSYWNGSKHVTLNKVVTFPARSMK